MTNPTFNESARLARDQLDLKGQTVMRGVLEACEGDIHEALRRLAVAIAWLTSPRADARAKAKARVREWLKAGDAISQEKR